ncbi:hypothetical protein MMUR_35400 [Mycolicibacterium murale]|jgi:hypothetical protein|uniref:Uncharacterized protein n=1 Tax=Mycolicibacterium murale TaxID=182220 RepID=A0A7I9WNV6_9MYCO|nr:hypothetical protein [Mycolicibacterium murale]GFG59404.1 hypothetical protein MMUR_35400 [Mycolicibacterium murale]
MTVLVTRSDGGTDEFARYGDRYVKLGDGSLEINRVGAQQPTRYPAGDWTTVSGDEKRSHRGLFRRTR